jgi:hypothetical protein
MNLAPITLFVYNRYIHTRKTVEALQKNDLARDSELYIFADGPKNSVDEARVQEVRTYLKTIKGFKKIYYFDRATNFGLAKSVISGVTEVINKFGKVIVVEDDIVTSANFLRYMNDAINFYQDNKQIFSISGYLLPCKIPKWYKYDVLLFPRPSTWGWGTWKDRWDLVDWEVKDYQEFLRNKVLQKKFCQGGDDLVDMLKRQMEGKIDSWGIRWSYTHLKNDVYALYPVVSKVFNIGNDGTGVHCGTSARYNVEIDDGKKSICFVSDIKPNLKIIFVVKGIFHRNIFKKAKSLIKKICVKLKLIN